jgi:hypothetical protein
VTAPEISEAVRSDWERGHSTHAIRAVPGTFMQLPPQLGQGRMPLKLLLHSQQNPGIIEQGKSYGPGSCSAD